MSTTIAKPRVGVRYSLTGLILPVGGTKQWILAAKRGAIHHVVVRPRFFPDD